MLLAIEMIGIIVVFYFIMNRILCKMDEGYWFKKPKREQFKNPGYKHNKSQQEHKESTETPKGTE